MRCSFFLFNPNCVEFGIVRLEGKGPLYSRGTAGEEIRLKDNRTDPERGAPWRSVVPPEMYGSAEPRRSRKTKAAHAVTVRRTIDPAQSGCAGGARRRSWIGEGVTLAQEPVLIRHGAHPHLIWTIGGAWFLEGVRQMCYAPNPATAELISGEVGQEFAATATSLRPAAAGVLCL